MSSVRGLLVPVAMVVAAIVAIQAGAAIAKTLFPVFGASGTTSIRLLVGSVLLLAVFRPWRNAGAWRDPTARRLLIGYGICLGAMNLLFYIALRGLPLGLVVATEFLGPLAVAVIASRRATDLLWAGLAIGGLALLLPIGRSGQAVDALSVLAALGAATGWALYIVFGQRLGQRAPAGAGHGVAWGMVIATVVVLPAGVATIDASWFDARWVWPALLVALLSTAIPYPLEMRALQRLPIRTFGILMSLEPAIAALAGGVMLGEKLTPLQYAAIGCIMTASAGSSLTALERGKVEAE